MNNEQILAAATAPKSDQLNADDLILANKIIRINKVLVNLQLESHKIWIHFDGDQGKPWKPSKSMARVLGEILGGDFDAWIGQHIELFRNKEITFGKEKCGGIQIAAMSALNNPVTVMVTTKRSVKSKITIQPLRINNEAPKKQSNPILKKIASDLQSASNNGENALLAITIPEEHVKAMADWYKKCLAHARQVDAARVAMQEPELQGFNPLQPKPDEDQPPAYDEPPTNLNEDRNDISDF